MKKQTSFSEAEYAGKKRVTKRERFLAEMEKVVPWTRLVAAVEPHYPKGERGRPPIGLQRMLRIYFLQQWYGLSDEGLEDALYDSMAMRAFAGIDLAVENVPDATTLLKFRRLLVEHDLTGKLFDEIGIMLCERGADDEGRHDRGCHHHRSAAVDQECQEEPRSGDAPDQEGQRMALWNEGTHWGGCVVGPGA
ncbi:hypothetical protein MAFF211520_38470 (plasmid) [Ralstonia pseudosolanacearum]|nr:hypothetical protein MAFF211520_00080 [Ralstonia pseudosolanacearum]BEU53555.1 hypothetical protein MAFF211520_38470 [Ralstonia pseudosolanacearum]BEU55742.1 hypothetical protein MAFF211521_07950 [Ralstonia pseudosolanacearum]BEU56623.1 hypothetical protein MAFF211521_16760 [Ralstonia pseudosolanacearum]BEU57362.1 hypothetical protein MAFF211521_24150 [Ralstonia pseudosolanacearum]